MALVVTGLDVVRLHAAFDHCTCRKGIGLIFRTQHRILPSLAQVGPGICGNANELGDATRALGGVVFSSWRRLPGIESLGDRDIASVEHRGSCGVRCARVVLEIRGECEIRAK